MDLCRGKPCMESSRRREFDLARLEIELSSSSFRVEAEKLIFHWMAHGCISSDGNEDVEDLGDQIWNELAVRSFFQEVRIEGRNTTFKMHDLIHDLAQSILENKISGTEIKHSGASASNDKIRHVEWRKSSKTKMKV
ncbi:hypothetical protein ACS0TY_030232 [Phlomoides rotata]